MSENNLRVDDFWRHISTQQYCTDVQNIRLRKLNFEESASAISAEFTINAKPCSIQIGDPRHSDVTN